MAAEVGGELKRYFQCAAPRSFLASPLLKNGFTLYVVVKKKESASA